MSRENEHANLTYIGPHLPLTLNRLSFQTLNSKSPHKGVSVVLFLRLGFAHRRGHTARTLTQLLCQTPTGRGGNFVLVMLIFGFVELALYDSGIWLGPMSFTLGFNQDLL